MVGKGVSARHSEMQLMAFSCISCRAMKGQSRESAMEPKAGMSPGVSQDGHQEWSSPAGMVYILVSCVGKITKQIESEEGSEAAVCFPGSSLLFPSFWLMSPIGRSCDWAGISREPWYEAGLAHTRWVIAPSHQPEAAAELGRTGGKLFTVHAVIP